MRIGTVLAAVAVAGALVLGPAAHAEVKRAESILPPGQSGFISAAGLTSGTGSPHLYDQQQSFIDFRWKPATFFQPGASVEPRAGVRITRDAFGVPSVVAATESDAWWGAGYAIAQDRLFQLELFRAATQGRLSEIVGRGRLDSDRIVRQDLYTPRELDAMFDRLAPDLQARFAAYRDGINAWVAHLATSPQDIPAEFAATTTPVRGWTIRDSVAIGVFLARTIPTNADPEGLELANMRALQLSGRRALDALVPLRTPGSLTTVPREQRRRFPSQPGRTRRDERAGLQRSARFVRDLRFPDPARSGAIAAPP
nr:penicillin acylase family protein [Solirubrobacterales bacterium]